MLAATGLGGAVAQRWRQRLKGGASKVRREQIVPFEISLKSSRQLDFGFQSPDDRNFSRFVLTAACDVGDNHYIAVTDGVAATDSNQQQQQKQ